MAKLLKSYGFSIAVFTSVAVTLITAPFSSAFIEERHAKKPSSAWTSEEINDSDGELAEIPEPPEKGRESRFFHHQWSLLPARIHYTGGLRLTGGNNSSYGIVEVSYNNIWGTICDDGMKYGHKRGKTTAQVICRLLGFPPPTTKANWFSFANKKRNSFKDYSVMQSWTNKIWLDEFYCLGNEPNIDKCIHKVPGVHNCVTSENIGVICESTSTPAITLRPATTSTRQTTTIRRSTQRTTKTTTKQASKSTTTAASYMQPTKSPSLPASSTCGRTKYGNNVPSFFIVGGTIAQPNQYPWITRLSIKTSSSRYLSCGGTIISRSHILTAAHCIDGVNIKAITAYLGDHNSAAGDPGEIAANVSSWTKHPLYLSRTSDYDVALLRLAENLSFSSLNIQPICLPTSCDTGCTKAGSKVSIAGWGRTSQSGPSSQYLRTASVEIGDINVCRTQYGSSTLTDRMICAGYLKGGVDTCQGDSGGPLMSNEDGNNYKLCGVTSYGNGCALPNYYGVYAKVCSQLNWIRTNAGLA